jgi:hypothetical protein
LLFHYGLVLPNNIVVELDPLTRVKPDEVGNDDESNGLSIIPPMALSNLDSSFVLGDVEAVPSKSL